MTMTIPTTQSWLCADQYEICTTCAALISSSHLELKLRSSKTISLLRSSSTTIHDCNAMTIASNLIAPFRSLLRPSSHKLSSFNPPPPVFPLAETPSQIARAPSLSLLSTNLPPASERAKRPAATPPSTLELVLHLLLLEAIYALVSSITDGPVRTYWMDNAVRRFEVWFPAMMTAIVADNAAGNGDLIPQMEGMPHLQPPLDVMMVWHTFLLNPGWYEDAIKKAYPDDPAIVKQVLGQEFPWFWIVSCALAFSF